MRFPFPAADPVAAASTEPLSVELNLGVDERAASPVTVSEPEPSSIDLTALDSPVSTTEFVPDPVLADITAESGLAEQSVALAPDPVTPAEPQPEAAPSQPLDAEPVVPSAVQPRPRSKRKVIAFPRQPGAAGPVHRLADPVLPEQPRILDVPEELEAFPTTPFLDGLRFEPAAASAVPDDHVELPFRAASIPLRIYAAVVDWSLVAVAAAAFAFIGHKMLPDLQFTKPVRLTAALVLLLLWAIYQYLFVVYAGRTAGMEVAGIRLSIFKGRKSSLRHRRNRVLGLYLSTASLVMGLLWAFVDVDTLCWHDRISGTYLTKRA
jgi:uncharacterized RDD family membrane protein YckC